MIENYIDRLLMPLTALTIFLLLFSTKVSSQQLHQNCSTSASSFDWDRTPNNNSQFDWPDGNLTNTLNNISGSGVNMTFTVSGDTDSLEAWQGSSTTSDSPAVGTDANGTDLLQLYTSGFSSASGVTITINFSEPVYAAGFDFAHVNASGPSGDKLVVTAKDNLNNTIFPTFTRSASPTYTADESTGTINANAGNTGSNSRIGVNFSDNDKITSITILWSDCDTCSLESLHGLGIAGFSFCFTQPSDIDNDGIADDIDMDDDNDGITDAIELCNANFIQELDAPKSIRVYIDLDEYEEETTWTLTGPNGFSQSGGPYADGNEIIDQTFSATEPGLYVFTIFDSFGDGIFYTQNSNSNGQAFYAIQIDGVTFFISTANPNFGASAVVNIEIEPDFISFPCLTTNPDQDDDFNGVVNYKDENYSTGVSGDFINANGTWNSLDFDGDGIPNHHDTDSDGDGCSDAIESVISAVLENNNTTINDIFGNNGYANTLEDEDTISSTPNFTNSYNTYALNPDINACGVAMITQATQSTTDRWVEITNIHSTNIIPTNALKIALFSNRSGDLSNISPNFLIANTSIINPGESILFSNSGSTITNIKVSPTNSNSLTNYSGENDVIVLSRTIGNITWDGRIDIVENIPDEGAKVRIDETLVPNTSFTASEWVNFVDDNLDPYRDLAEGGPERHPHDPLFSEIEEANTEANIRLGLHRIDNTERRSGAWDNGFPDRSRYVRIIQNYNHSSTKFSARKLFINNGRKLTVNDNLLIVTDEIEIGNSTSTLRLAGSSQLIQTHNTNAKVTGSGKLFKDRLSDVASIYRYNYLSSPVNTVGSNDFTLKEVLKDGSSPTSNNSTPLDINFIGGFDGNAETNPISIAEYWVYTFASADGTRSNYKQQKSTGVIPETDGFLLKGPGVSQNYTFAGTPKDGNLSTNVGGGESYLVGNPYASALSSKKFIEDNINSIDGTLYFWEHAGETSTEEENAGHSYAGYVGGYSTRNISMGLSANQVSSNNNTNNNTPRIGEGSYKAPKAYIAVGQGFFIGGDEDGGEIVFNNSQREFIVEGDQSTFFKSSNTKTSNKTSPNSTLPIIKLGLDYIDETRNKLHRQIGISFNANNSFAIDKGYDSELFDLGKTDFYWSFSPESKLSIAGVEDIKEDLQIPLVITKDDDEIISISIDEAQNISKQIYLFDSFTGTSKKLTHNKLFIELPEGNYEDRFLITFKENTTLSTSDEVLNSELNVFVDNSKREIVIQNFDNLTIKKASLYNILGQEVKIWKGIESNSAIKLPLNKVQTGFYIFNLDTENGKKSKKFFIE